VQAPVYEAFCGVPRPERSQEERLAPVTASPAGRKSPAGKNRVLVTATVEPPVAETQRPNMGRLMAVLAVCFALGLAWPIAGGLVLTQRPPGSSPPKVIEAEAESLPDGEPGAASPVVAAMHAAPLAMENAPVHVDKRVVQSCEGNAGEALARCDAPNLEGALEAPLAKLGSCAQARGISGVLSLGMYVDFSRGHITRVKPGQSTTLSQEQTAMLLGCAEENIVGATLDDVTHAHARYWVYHVLRFMPPGSPADGAPGEVVHASGQATIGWKAAIVREGPSSQAPVAARLGYGTRISVTGRTGDWYRIERAGTPLGWVHRDALGL
jgi:hypothetical protein